MLDLVGYRLFLLRKGVSSKTVDKSVRFLKRLWKKHQPLDLDSVNRFVNDQLEKNASHNSLNVYIGSLRNLAAFDSNFRHLHDYPYFKPRKSNVSVLSLKELEEFLSLKNPHKNRGYMWDMYQLFFGLLAYTGARPGEIAALTKNHVDFGRGVFTLSTSKTNSPRNIPIPDPYKKAVKQRLKSKFSYLFTNKFGNPINNDNWSIHFRNRLKLLGIKRKGLTCYSLRHSFITHMLEEDVNVFKVKKIVGHKSFQTTERYTHLTTKDIVKAARQHPLVKKAASPNEKLEAWLVVTKELLGNDFYINEEKLVKSVKQKTTPSS